MGKAEDGAILGQVPSERLPLLGPAQPSLPYLSQGEVAQQASLAPWPGLRKALGGLLGGLLGALLVMAVVLLVTLPRPRPPLAWWQKSAFYHLPPSAFADSDGDGQGDLEGVKHQLDQLLALPIQALVLGPIIVGNATNLSRILPAHGSLEQLQALLDGGRKKGVRILLELPAWDEELEASGPHNQTRRHVKEAMEFWQEQGVDGFVVGKEPARRLEQVLDAWRELDSQSRTDRSQERLLMVWDKSGSCSISRPVPSSVILACHLLGAAVNLSAPALVQQLDLALQRPRTPWPGWMVPRDVPLAPGLEEILGVLQLTLPGVPLLHGGEGSPIPLQDERTDGNTSGHSLASTSGHSLASTYHALLALRTKSFSLHGVDFAPLPLPEDAKEVLAFLRPGSCSGVLVLLNLGRLPRRLSPNQLGIPAHAQVLFNTHPEPQKEVSMDLLPLAPFQALLLRMPGGRGQ